MSVLVLVEGVSDAGFVKGVAEKVGAAIVVRHLRGNRPDKAKRMVEAVHAERVVVLKDEHRYPGLAELAKRELGSRAIVVRVKCSVESWILIGLHAESSEACDDPARRLREVLARKGLAKVPPRARGCMRSWRRRWTSRGLRSAALLSASC